MKRNLILGALIATTMISCNKNKEDIETYVYAKDLEVHEEARLFIDGKQVGLLKNSPVTPNLCFDSTLTECYVTELSYGSHDFQLRSMNDEQIAAGYIKIRSNSTSGGARGNQGGIMSHHINADQSVMIVGMNTGLDENDRPQFCAQN